MRLTELTSPSQNKTVLKEDTEVNSSPTILISPAEIYQMAGQIPPSIEGPNGTMIQPEGWYDRVEMEVGTEEGMVTPAYAQAHNEWVNGGRVPGLLWDSETNTMKPYNENGVLEDLGWAIAAGAFETASAMTKGGAKVLDDTLSLVTYVGTAGNVNTFGNNKILKKTMASSTVNDKGERVYDEFILDDAANWFTNNTDQAFQDNVEWTSGAVNSFSDVAGLFLGGVPGGWEGALGIMASELPSEILDLGLMIASGGTAGLVAGGVLNAFEAGGAAASEIQKTIDAAYDRGVLQETPQYQVMLNAATQQIIKDNPDMSPADVAESASILAREQLTHGAINRGFYAVAATGGVADTIQNKVAYGGPIRKKFLGNALGKAIISPASEAIGEMGEQLVTNMAIRNKAGKIVQVEDGVINAGWNGWIAGNTATMVGTGASVIGKGNQAQRAARARLRQFFAGGSKDPEALIDVMSMDANALRTYVTDNNGKLRLGELVRERNGLVTMEDLTTAQQRQVNARRSKGVVIDGKRYTKRQLEENSRDLELIDKFNNIDIDPRENKAVVILDSEEDIRRVAALLGLESKGKINKVMANLEEVRKLDFRIQGRSNLEAPVWSDLNRRQRQEYIKNGSVTFVGDKERGNQTWTRDQIMFNSRRNQDDVPDDIANLLDNTDPRPTLSPDDQREMQRLQALIDNNIAMTAARRELEADQKDWDAEAQRNGEEAARSEFGPRPSEDMEGDPYNFTGARASTSMAQTTIDQIKKAQTYWDTQYGDTHNPNGVVIYSKPSSAVTNFVRRAFIAKPKTSGVDTVDTTAPAQPTDDSDVDTTAPAQPTDDSDVDTTPASGLASPQGADDAVDVDTDTSPITPDDLINDDKKKVVAPVVLTPGETTSKAHVTYLHKIAIANGDMDPISVAAMLKKSEKSFPGITNDVLPGGIDSYVQDPRAVKKTLQNDSKTQTAPTDVTRNGKPPKGTSVELNGQDYTFAGAMWVPIKPDGSRGSTGHKNHKELTKKWQDSTIDQTIPDRLKTPDMDSADNIDTTAPDAPANTDASIKKAQDQVTPDLTPEPVATDPAQQGGRGTPPTAAQSAERAAMRKDTAQAAANARIAQQKADKIKADAQAKTDAQNTASDAKLIAQGKRIADQQAVTKADAQNTASDAKLIARGKEIADQQAVTKADAQNTASDAKLIALAKAFSDAAKDAKTSKQNQASDDKLIALAKAQSDADRDAAIQAKKQADLDAQQQAKDAQAQRDAEQAQRDAEQQQQQQQQDQQQQQQQQDQQQQQQQQDQQQQQQQQQQQDLTPVVLPKLSKKQQKTQAQSEIMTKKQADKKANKAIRSRRGVDKPAQKRNLKLHPFTPLTMPDPMNLSRYKSFGENTNGKNNMKNLQEGYKIMPPMDPKYTERSGLEGPFTTLSGKVVYYDPKEGSYYDPDTDMYMSYDEFQNYDKDYSGMKDERDEVEETLSPEEKKLVAKMYNKDGTLTDLGKRVMGTKESRTLENLMSRVFDNALSEFEFNPRAGHRDQPSHPENQGLTPDYPETIVRPKARPKKLAPTSSPRPRARPANLQMRNNINKAVQQAVASEGINEEDPYASQTIMDEDPPLGINYDYANLPKVDWDKYSTKAIKEFLSVIENLDFESGHNSDDFDDMHFNAVQWIEKNVLAKRQDESVELDEDMPEMANEYYESIAAQNVLDNSILAKENVDKLRKIVSNKSMMPIKFDDGTMNVDMTTANIFVKAFDKMKETNQAKVSEMIKTKAGFLRVMDIIYGAMK